MTIEQAFDILMPFEGNDTLTDNPSDKGGKTRFGISQAAYPNVDIENLTADKAKAIYASDYWLKGNCQKLKTELQYVMFDTCVNMGVETATKILQESCGAEPDGIFGSETLTKSDNATIGEYLFLRECYDALIVTHRQIQIEFLGGWTNRNKQILQLYKSGKLS